MSDSSSGRAASSSDDGRSRQSPESHNEEAQVLATVQQELVKGGVKPERAASVARIVMTRVESYHSGPLPTVETFAGYENVCVGAARDILNMAKAEQAHHHAIQKADVYGEIALKALGLIMAMVVIGGMLAAALYAATTGHDGLAIAIGSGTGLSLVAGVFVRNMGKKKPDTAINAPRKNRKR